MHNLRLDLEMLIKRVQQGSLSYYPSNGRGTPHHITFLMHLHRVICESSHNVPAGLWMQDCRLEAIPAVLGLGNTKNAFVTVTYPSNSEGVPPAYHFISHLSPSLSNLQFKSRSCRTMDVGSHLDAYSAVRLFNRKVFCQGHLHFHW